MKIDKYSTLNIRRIVKKKLLFPIFVLPLRHEIYKIK